MTRRSVARMLGGMPLLLSLALAVFAMFTAAKPASGGAAGCACSGHWVDVGVCQCDKLNSDCGIIGSGGGCGK